MKTCRNPRAHDRTSASTRTECAKPTAPISAPARSLLHPSVRPRGLRLSLVEEAAAVESACALLRGELDVARRQQEHLVGHALHAAVERVREAAREVDQPLGQ